MEYAEGMEQLDHTLMNEVISRMEAYDYNAFTSDDVKTALSHGTKSAEDFMALLSPAALEHLEEIAQAARLETKKHFGNSVNMFTPLYISNYCENY